jgi:hypothetical protein
MPVYADQPVIAIGASFIIPLSPNDRFGGNGGTVRIRTVALTGATGALKRTVFVGNELIESRNGVLLKAAGVDNFTPAASAIGSPGAPIKIQIDNPTAGAITLDYFVEIENY